MSTLPTCLDGTELDGSALKILQLDRLRTSIAHAYAGNPAYRTKLDTAGVHPDDIATLDDLALFPFTTKADLRDNYPFGFFAVPTEQIARLHASSGTTGKPCVAGYTRDDISTWAQLVARSIYVAGGRPGMKVHVAYGYGLFTGGLGAHYGAEELGCTVIPMSGGQTEKQVQLITDFAPEIIMVTPSYMLALADGLRAAGIDPASTSLRIGIFGAEPWTEAMRSEIEAIFNITAVDIYGLSEVIGPGVAQEYADSQDGLTIWEDHFYPEIVNPETGKVLTDGEEGELVLTSLTKQAMPIIRYRTRDLTRLLPGTHGAMRRMARIAGRSDDMMIVRGVNVFPSQIEEQILKCVALTGHYEIELTRPNRLDEVLIKVESRDYLSRGEGEAIGAELVNLLKTTVGITTAVEVVAPETIARSTGKAVHVFDRR